VKLFSIDEANDLIPGVALKLQKIQELYRRIDELREAARSAAEASDLGGGMAGGTAYVRALYEVGKLTTELHDDGVQLKDYSRGLVDFPCMRDGRVVLLCWQLGEPEQIEWWHELEAGFAGRQPL
jgi:hypothetical protein